MQIKFIVELFSQVVLFFTICCINWIYSAIYCAYYQNASFLQEKTPYQLIYQSIQHLSVYDLTARFLKYYIELLFTPLYL